MKIKVKLKKSIKNYNLTKISQILAIIRLVSVIHDDDRPSKKNKESSETAGDTLEAKSMMAPSHFSFFRIFRISTFV